MQAHYADLDLLMVLTAKTRRTSPGVVKVRTEAVRNAVLPFAAVVRHPGAVAVSLARYSREKQLDLLVRCFAKATDTADLRHWQLHLTATVRTATASSKPSTIAESGTE